MDSLTVETIESLKHDSWSSRHSKTEKPYFEEFTELLNHEKAGCYGYKGDIAVNDYFAINKQEQEETSSWVECLIENAKKHKKRPLLSFCRSMGRVNFLKERFSNSVNILLYRDPFEIFRSNHFQVKEHSNMYFSSMYSLIIAYNRSKIPVFGKYYNDNKLPEVSGNIFNDLEKLYETEDIKNYKKTFRDFYFVFHYCMTQIKNDSIVFIDFTRFGDERYRKEMADKIVSLGFEGFNFNDYKATDISKDLVDENELRKIAEEIEKEYF